MYVQQKVLSGATIWGRHHQHWDMWCLVCQAQNKISWHISEPQITNMNPIEQQATLIGLKSSWLGVTCWYSSYLTLFMRLWGSAFAIYGNVFNISRETSFGNLGDNTCDVGGTRNNGRGGGLPRWWARFEERFNAALWHFGNGLFDVDLRAWCFDGDFMFFHHSW